MIEIPLNLARKISIFGREYPEEVNRFYLRKIKRAVERDQPQAIFYRIENTNVVAGVPAEKYIESLEEIMAELISIELYELASECQKLIDKVKINQIIRESQDV